MAKDLRTRVAAHGRVEGKETRSQEASESAAFQREERRQGVEQHRRLKPGKPLQRKGGKGS